MSSSPLHGDSASAVEVTATACVCARCGKVAVIRKTKLSYDDRRRQGLWPIGGVVYKTQCPDGCDGGLTNVTCRGSFVPGAES